MSSNTGSACKIKLNSFDELFGGQEDHTGDVKMIPLSDLHEFHNHPFRVEDDTAMQELVSSIREKGVIHPGICRPDGSGGYEIISGHRRKHACELAGFTEMPFLVRNLTDDEATVLMVDANLQREVIRPSEKACAYLMKQKALAHSGRKMEQTTAEQIGALGGDSGRTVQRYIRLTCLSGNILAYVDAGKISLGAGEALSYLSEDEQSWLEEAMGTLKVCPSLAMANILKESSKNGELVSLASIFQILKKTGNSSPAKKITLQPKKLQQYFTEEYTAEEMEKVIFQLLEEWKKREE